MLMLLTAFIKWWYADGWFRIIKNTKSSLGNLAKNYSVGILLKTLFAPWKQISAANSANNKGLNGAMNKFMDKSISRLVGFTIRSTTLLAAGFSLLFMFLFRIFWFIVWPLLPVLPLAALIYGLGIFNA